MPTSTKPVGGRSAGRTKTKRPAQAEAPERVSKAATSEAARAKPSRAAPPAETKTRLMEDVVEVGGGQGKYVYCIVRSDDPLQFGRIGLGAKRSDVRSINYTAIAAVE